MGNCITSSKVMAHEDREHEKTSHESTEAIEQRVQTSSKSMKDNGNKKKKTVRFKLDHEDQRADRERNLNSDSLPRSGAVRVRMVITQKELKKILTNFDEDLTKLYSVEELISALKSRDGRISEVGISGDIGINGNWRPALQCIPEDQD